VGQKGDLPNLSLRVLLVFLAVAILLCSVPASFAYSGKALTLRVYADGYVDVTQTLATGSRSTSVVVPLLSEVVSNLVATDQNGSPLSYSFGPGNANITVYTLGATSVTLRYDTDALTSKNGTVWTLTYATEYNSTVVLPPLSTLSFVSGAPYPSPYSINETNAAPELDVPAGTWTISYGAPIAGLTTTSSPGPGGGASGFLGLSAREAEEAGAAAAALAAAGLSILLWRRRGPGPTGGGLRPDDVQVLSFIRENGGKVLEPEIRAKFALPKTSGWRQIKRLERLGYVRVRKIGTQNQIEVVKDRGASPQG
jgi:uncharacterized membrane protein